MSKKHIISLCLAVVLLICAVVFLSAPRAKAEDALHSHCVCGGLQPEGHICKNVEWTPWDGTSVSGTYYLTEDVNLAAMLQVAAGNTLNLDLNGHIITGGEGLRVFYVGTSTTKATLNICDCKGSGKIVCSNETGNGGLAFLYRNGTFNLYGGTLENVGVGGTNSRLVKVGSGSYACTFNMYGGKLTGGNVDGDGGAVTITNSVSKFYMYGGEITGNTATGNGGGVYNNGGTFQVSGNAKITGNAGSNVYLSASSKITVKELGSEASIGVVTAAKNGDIGTADADPNGKIFCDDSSKIVVYDEAGNLTLAERPSHDHCVCGGLKPEGHICKDVKWTPWDGTSVSGNFYLTGDVTLTEKLSIPTGTTLNLDLNGYTITGAEGLCIFYVGGATSSGATRAYLNICDCVGTGKLVCSSTEKDGGLAFLYRNATMNLYGGTLEMDLNTPSASGRPVKVGSGSYAGAFNMYGGKLTGGNVDGDGGGVTVANSSSKFNMYGGEISGNTATGNGGGVYVPAGATFQVSGNAKITDNTPSNVYLPTGAAMTVIDLGENASIGVTVVDETIGTADADPNGKIFSDNSDLNVCYSNGSLTLEVPGHRHCVCGGLKPEGHTCEDVEWQPWDGTSVSGNYYLTEDVKLTKMLRVNGDTTLSLDLNGHTITGAEGLRIFYVGNGEFPAYLNICDCVGTGKLVCSSTEANGGLVFLYRNATLNLYGGTLEMNLNAPSASGRVVKVGNGSYVCTFNMYGGKLTGGNVDGDGGGVTIANSVSKFYMYGGEISGNTATGNGGGVYNNSGTFQVSGNARITDNTPSNVYLRSGAAMTVIDLGENASVGVTAVDAAIGTADADPNGKIFSDNSDLNVCYSNGSLTLEVPGHRHCVCGGVGAIGDHTECTDVEWQPWDGTAVSGSYYLTEDVTLTEMLRVDGGTTLSLDLNGHTITGAEGLRVFYVGSNASKAILNICDCKGTGKIVCSNETGNGGLVFLYRNATLNLFSGTLINTANGTHSRLVRVGSGDYAGTFNMYGGTLTGGNVIGNGGGILVSNSVSTLNLYGGSIENCTATGNGSNIYVSKGGTVNVFGDVQVENLHLSYGAVIGADGMTENGKVRFATVTTDGTVVCTRTGANADWVNDHLIWDAPEDDARALIPVGDRVYLLNENTPAAKVGSAEYATLYEAVQANPGAMITLETNFAENVTVSDGDFLIDLNGHTLIGSITLGKDITLKGFDSSSDKYGLPSGRLAAELSGGSVATTTQNTVNKKRYLAVEVDGSWTFNRFYIGMQSITADVNSGDIGYKAIVGGNTNVENMLAADGNAFGFKVWVEGFEELAKTPGLTKDAFYSGITVPLTITKQLSTIQKVYAEQDPTYTGVAKELADKPVKAQVTISFADGTTVESSIYEYSVVNMYKELNNGFDKFSGVQKLKLKTLTEAYPVMKNWNLDKMAGYVSTGDEWLENAFFKESPEDDGVLRILAIGNSFCYYFTDELYGMLAADGMTVEVANIYYSGCTVQRHWTWLNDGSQNYELIVHSKDGKKSTKGLSMIECLQKQNWDIITLQQHFTPSVASTPESALDSCRPYVKDLYNYLKDKFPMAQFMWHHTWAYQVGYQGPVGKDPADVADADKVLTAEKQTRTYENIRTAALAMCQENGVSRIPSGDAWQIARSNPVIGDNLCARLASNNGAGDNYHDGDIGGGQYLNACVWYEVLTGKDCRENPFRPVDYELSGEMVTAIQEAAHQAVQEMHAS